MQINCNLFLRYKRLCTLQCVCGSPHPIEGSGQTTLVGGVELAL